MKLFWVFAVFLLTLPHQLAFGQDIKGATSNPNALKKSTATFGNWTNTCTAQADGALSCEITQFQYIRNETVPISGISIRAGSDPNLVDVTLQVPPDVWVADGAKLVVAEGFAIVYPIRWCNSSRCIADNKTQSTVLAKLRDVTTPGQIGFKDASQTDISIPVSFDGFAGALDDFKKRDARFNVKK